MFANNALLPALLAAVLHPMIAYHVVLAIFGLTVQAALVLARWAFILTITVRYVFHVLMVVLLALAQVTVQLA